MSNFTKGIILIILGICIGLLSTVVPEAIGVFIPLAVFLGILGIFKLIDDWMKNILLLLLLIPMSMSGQHNVTATYYHAGPKHGLSWHTASGNRISVKKLNAGKLRWAALSHNLLKHYDYGDTIIVVSNNPKLRGKWVVMDKMHKRHYNKIDFLTPSGKNLGMLKPTKVKIKKKE